MKKIVLSSVFFSIVCFAHGNFESHHSSSHNLYDSYHHSSEKDYHHNTTNQHNKEWCNEHHQYDNCTGINKNKEIYKK